MLAGGLVIATIGAILIWGIERSAEGIDLDVAGWIVLGLGATMTVFGLASHGSSDHERARDPRSARGS